MKKLDPKCHYKIIVSGTPQELRSLKLSSYLQKISKYKIAYKTISTIGTSVIEENIGQKDFLELLFDEIKECTDDIQEKSDMIYCFQELFGQIQKPNIIS